MPSGRMNDNAEQAERGLGESCSASAARKEWRADAVCR